MSRKRQKILILHFQSLNNYGTGMMGLNTIQFLADRLGSENIEFHCDFDKETNIEEIQSELRTPVLLNRYFNPIPGRIRTIRFKLLRRMISLLYLLFYFEGTRFDRIIVLGGDDLSEYYDPHDAAFDIWGRLKSSFFTPVFLLGQSIGPFNNKINRFAAKWFLPHLKVYSRDAHCTQYLLSEFGVKIKQMADLALLDLPLQADRAIEQEILSRYQLKTNDYFTVVVSGLQKDNFFCSDLQIYLNRFKLAIETLIQEPWLQNKKVCLLAHTFPPYADESLFIQQLANLLDQHLRERVVVIGERILQARARFILGNGLFTLTARMHPAVSTFQMGRPAICLSYSPKYKGVIGDSIGRYDLVVEANDSELWKQGDIVKLILEKYHYLKANYETLCAEITASVTKEKKLVINALNEI